MRGDANRTPRASGCARHQTHRVTLLAGAHVLEALGVAAPAQAAELAHKHASVEAVDALTLEGRAVAVRALMTVGFERVEAAPQQLAFEVGGSPVLWLDHES
jgi:hypothetical protein